MGKLYYPLQFISNDMKIIHSRLLLALSALLLAACSQPKDKFIFEGKIAGIQQAEFYVYSDDGALSGVDTIRRWQILL